MNGTEMQANGGDSFQLRVVELFMESVDVVSAVRKQGGLDEYMELLDLFFTDGQKRMGLLEDLIETQQVDSYVTEVHGLKSASANIGAKLLSELAKAQEEAGKAGQLEFIREHSNALFAEYRVVLAEIKRVLSQQEYGQFAQRDFSHLPSLEMDQLIYRVKSALGHLEDFESKEAAEEVDTILRFAVPENARTQLERVQGMLKMYEDDDAEDALRELLAALET